MLPSVRVRRFFVVCQPDCVSFFSTASYLKGDGGIGINAASRQDLKGSVVRLTSDGGIPPDNPYASVPHSTRCNRLGRPPPNSTDQLCQEIYSYGFRHPFHFANDPKTGRFFVNDVGWNSWEEINELVPGGDYGWPSREGPCQSAANGSVSSAENCFDTTLPYVDPIYWYRHPRGRYGVAAAFCGGAFVPDGIWPRMYEGSYMFTDFPAGTINLLTKDVACKGCSPPSPAWTQTLFHKLAGLPVQLTFGPFQNSSALYYNVRRSADSIRRIYFDKPAGNSLPTTAIDAFFSSSSQGLTVHFDGTGSSDPDGDPLIHEWDFGDRGIRSTQPSPTHHYSSSGTYSASLTVTDSLGGRSTQTMEIRVANEREPIKLMQWRSGVDCPAGYDYCGTLEFCTSSETFGYRLACEQVQCDCPRGPGPTLRIEAGKKYRLTLRNSAPTHCVPTNIHTHGLHIVGSGDGDDVTRSVSGGGCLGYTWDILSDHPGGTYWYHAHHHGNTEKQVRGGAFGMLVVEENELLNQDIPDWARNDVVLQISRMKGHFFGNGHPYEVFRFQANRWYRLRVSIVDPVGAPNSLVFVGGQCVVHRVASDGIWHSTIPGLAGHSFEMTGASRGDFAIRCESANSFANIRYGNDITAIISIGSVDPYAPAVVPSWKPKRPSALANISEASIPSANKMNVRLQRESINGASWDPSTALATIAFEQVHEWTIFDSYEHPFHMHLYHMQVVTRGGCGEHREGEFYDTIASPIPCTVRFKTADFGQRLVLHCHILSHEDIGAMVWVDVDGPGMIKNEVLSPARSCSLPVPKLPIETTKRCEWWSWWCR